MSPFVVPQLLRVNCCADYLVLCDVFPSELLYPALGRERRIRSYVPNISSIVANFKRNFEYVYQFIDDSLEEMFVSRL